MFVVDANVVQGYFLASVIGSESHLTACPKGFFHALGPSRLAYVDDDGQIKAEWRAVVDPEWLEAWYADLIRDDKLVPVSTDQRLSRHFLKRLHQEGFPRSRDVWYVRVAFSVVSLAGACTLVTEDLDFYDPAEKQCTAARRERILRSSEGWVVKAMRAESILVRAVCVASSTA